MTVSEYLDFFRQMSGQALVDDILAYEKIASQYDGQQLADSDLPWQTLGQVEQADEVERGLRFKCERGWVQLTWLAVDCLHVRHASDPDEFDTYFSYAIDNHEWSPVNLAVIMGENAIVVKTGPLVYRIGKRPFRLGIETADSQVICIDSEGIQIRGDGAVRLATRMHPQESSYGLGERAEGLDLRGKRFRLWNADPPQYKRGSDPLYYSIPFYLGVHDDVAYGVFWDNACRGVADLGRETPSDLIFEAESGPLSYYLFGGESVSAVVSRFTELTGRINLPPLWFLGYQQCRWSYFPQSSVLDIAQQFRDRSIPCDVIYLDIHYMDDYRVFTWDKERFPDLKGTIDTLHRQGFKVVAIVDPGIKVDPGYEVYQNGIEEDVFLKYPNGERVAAPVWPGTCHFPDFTDPKARAWWQRQLGDLLDLGFDGLWNDMCEPAVFRGGFTDTLLDHVWHDREGLGGDHRENHNVYGMQMARATLGALRALHPESRPVNMLRAGYAGTQRYASSWTGDNSSTWDHLRLSISMTLNMGLSGSPMTGPDVGGFFGDADAELVTRWLQATCLMPYFRNHSALGTAQQEPWVFGQPYEVINRMSIQQRYRLLPYLYSVVAQSAEYGWPVIRPVFMEEPQNRAVRSIDDCYMLGDGLLVAPVVQKGAVSRRVYLPASSDWYDYWTNERFEGGQEIEVTASLERLPLFARAGLMLPMWPDMQHTGQQAVEKLNLRLYPGDHETVLYEDRGEGLEYQQGDYRWVYITAVEADDLLQINRRVAGRYEPVYRSLNLEVVGLDDEPFGVTVDRQGASLWFYDEGILEITTDNFSAVEIELKSSSSDRTLPSRPW